MFVFCFIGFGGAAPGAGGPKAPTDDDVGLD